MLLLAADNFLKLTVGDLGGKRQENGKKQMKGRAQVFASMGSDLRYLAVLFTNWKCRQKLNLQPLPEFL